MILEPLIHVLTFAAFAFIIWFGIFALRASNQLLPLLRTLLEQKLDRGGSSADAQTLSEFTERVDAVERALRGQEEEVRFMRALIESGSLGEGRD